LKGRVDPIKFSVSYTLSEYLSFVRDHLPVVMAEELARKGKSGKTPGKGTHALIRATTMAVASVVFFFKKRRMPVCDFEIDEENITRTTADGRLVVPWGKVVAIHRYSQGYLVVKGEGALPLPFRCLLSDQATALAALIDKRQRELQPVRDIPE
jgi:hypothetical protein